jgi:hypothetical protein
MALRRARRFDVFVSHALRWPEGQHRSDVPLDPFAKSKLAISVAELEEERALVADLLPGK